MYWHSMEFKNGGGSRRKTIYLDFFIARVVFDLYFIP